MPRYTHRIFESVAGVPDEDWTQVCYPPVSEHSADPFMELQFVRALEESMAPSARFWPVIIDDESGRPAACACLTLYRIDGVVLAGKIYQRITSAIRKVFPGYVYFRILICGLPVSAGQSSIRMRSDANAAEVAAALDRVVCQVAREQGVRVLVVKEFDIDECQRLSALEEHGYLRADSLPINVFDPCFPSFDAFRGLLNHDYRKKFKKSERKFAAAGLRSEIMTDPARILEVYTPEVHRLYDAVEEHAHHRFEHLPAEFFRALVRQFPGQVSLLVAWRETQIVGFVWAIMHRGVFCNLFIGLDYSLNSQADLYFNLMMQNMDYCLRQRPAQVFVGQTADQFKSRLGCYQRSRYFFVKARGWPLAVLLRLFRRLLFPPAPAAAPQPGLFKERRTTDQGPAAAAPHAAASGH